LSGERHAGLTFKRRYPADGGLGAALVQAERDGFDAGEGDYEAELEWGLRKRTLTFSNEKQVGRGDGLPRGEEARRPALDGVPGKWRRWVRGGWAEEILARAHTYGPVHGRRWRGGRAGIDDKISVEVWEILAENGRDTERVVEVSFKAKDVARAEA